MTTPLDRDAVNPNFLDVLAGLQARVENLERQAASGLFDGDEMKPPGGVTIEGGNLQVVGNRGIFRSMVNLGSGVTLTVDSNEITVTQTYHKIAEGDETDLQTINGGIDGDALWLLAVSGDSITINQSGNIIVRGTSDTLTDSAWFLAIYNGETGKWVGEPAL